MSLTDPLDVPPWLAQNDQSVPELVSCELVPYSSAILGTRAGLTLAKIFETLGEIFPP